MFLVSPFRQRRFRSLMAKLLWPIAGLMLISLLGGTLAFAGSTALIQNQLLKRQVSDDAVSITGVLQARQQEVFTAARLLALSPEIRTMVDQDSELSMSTLNSRAVTIRDRFDLHLVQIYDVHELRTNLVVSSLYRESALLSLTENEQVVVRVVDGRVLMLGRVAMPDSAGYVVCGIDLDVEFNRLVESHRLQSDLGLSLEGIDIRTRDGLVLDPHSPREQGTYREYVSIELGQTSVSLLLSRSTADVNYVMSIGLLVMVLSMLLTTALLLGMSVLIARSISRPIQQLSEAAQSVAEGDLDHQVVFAGMERPFGIGDEDEIGLLAHAFNLMVAQLRGLYQTLEAKVDARMRELATTAQVAEAVSSSLDKDIVLQNAVQAIKDRLDLDQVNVLLVNDTGEVLESCQSCGDLCESCPLATCTIPIGSGSIIGTVAASGQPYVTQDVTTDPVFLRMHGDRELGSAAAVPILVEDLVIGVLYAQSLAGGHFTADMVNLLSTLADQLAVGLQNARLFEALRDRMHDLEQAQAQLVQSEKMAAVGQLAAGIAHDFNNLLTAINGYTELLLNEDLAPSIAADLREVQKAAERAAALTSQLLTFSRKQVIQPEVLILNAVADNMKNMLSRLIGEHITLEMDLCPELAAVSVDPGQIEQVLMNLVVNARDAIVELSAAQGGRITIRTSNVELVSEDGLPPDVIPGSYVRLGVIDTGIGMDGETMSHLFEPFFTTKGVGKGTGLGLATVYGIVKQNRGHIEATSTPGQGATLSVYLPSVEARSLSSQEQQPRLLETATVGTILLVEDQEMVRRLVTRVLSSRGYDVLEAGDGASAIEILAQRKGAIDLVLTDIVMPGGISGFDVAARARDAFPEVHVLYMSGYSDEHISDPHVLQDGTFIRKPFMPNALAAQIGEILSSARELLPVPQR